MLSDAKGFVNAFIAEPKRTVMRLSLSTEFWWIVQSNYERTTVTAQTGVPSAELSPKRDD